MTTREEIESKKNVVGTVIGENGQLIVFVTKKVPESELDEEDIIDKIVDVDGDQAETDVEPAGGVPHKQHQSRHRPVPGGVSIGTDDGGSGTVGSPTMRLDEKYVKLSNAHVAEGTETVYQPAWMDGGDRNDSIGNVIDYAHPEPVGTNQLDCALIEVDEDQIKNEVYEVGPLGGFIEAEYGREYTKSGRTTGVTHGELIGRDGRFTVAYGPDDMTFTGIDVYTGMSEAGDSGSFIGIVEDKEFEAASILFGGSPQVTLGIPIERVMEWCGEFEIVEEEQEKDRTYAIPWVLRGLFNSIFRFTQRNSRNNG